MLTRIKTCSMKKISLFLMTVLVLFLLGACKNEESKQPEPQPEPVPDPELTIAEEIITVDAADKDAPNPGEFIPGYQSQLGQGVLSGTRYVGAWEAGFISRCAPAVGGELEITNHGDGTYTIKFAFLDDLGNTWDGEWTGAMSVLDFSSFSPEQRAAKMADLGRL